MAVSKSRIDAALKDLYDAMEMLGGTATRIDGSAEPHAQRAAEQREFNSPREYDSAFPSLPPAPRVTFASQLAKLKQTISPQQQQESRAKLVPIYWWCGHTTWIDDSHAKAEDYCPAPYSEPFPCHSPACRHMFLKFCQETSPMFMKTGTTRMPRLKSPPPPPLPTEGEVPGRGQLYFKKDFPVLPSAKEMAPVGRAKDEGRQAARWVRSNKER